MLSYGYIRVYSYFEYRKVVHSYMGMARDAFF